MRDLGTPEGFGRMYQEDMVEPLRRVIEAYRPVSVARPDVSSWRELFDSVQGNTEEDVAECTGRGVRGGCRDIDNEIGRIAYYGR